MRIVDLNLLLYAIDRTSPLHPPARAWLETTWSGEEPIGLPWIVLLGFLRLSTSPRIFTHPLTSEQALALVDEWLERPCVRAVAPGEEHWRILRALLAETGAAGNLTTDAHLAAIAIEHGAELCSCDSDFARFPRLRWVDPLKG